MKFSDKDIEYMREALRLAEMMNGRTSPDPTVGAVILRNGRVVGRGNHAEAGTPHAEAVAIQDAGAAARGATMYVSLEPCAHYGNNPPCADAIIAAGIKKVIASMKDPNPLVSGKGFAKLKRAGVKVQVGLLHEEAAKINEFFLKFITRRRPFVILKAAMSMDGKIATSRGQSQWISSLKSRAIAHGLRNKVDAVMVGIGTVLADDPKLTVRLIRGRKRDPKRVIVDPYAKTPLKSRVLNHEPDKTIIAVSSSAPKVNVAKIKRLGANVIEAKSKNGVIDLKNLMSILADEGVMSVMIEGGGGLAASAIEAGIVDKIMYFIAPKIIGGRNSPTPVEGDGIIKLSQAVKLRNMKCSSIGEDVLIEGEIPC